MRYINLRLTYLLLCDEMIHDVDMCCAVTTERPALTSLRALLPRTCWHWRDWNRLRDRSIYRLTARHSLYTVINASITPTVLL